MLSILAYSKIITIQIQYKRKTWIVSKKKHKNKVDRCVNNQNHLSLPKELEESFGKRMSNRNIYSILRRIKMSSRGL